MTDHATDASLDRIARITGGMFLMMAVAGFTGFGIRTALIVPGDAAATAQGILASDELFRLAFIGDLIAFLLDVPVALLLYVLLRPVSKTVALIAAGFRLVYTAIVAANLLNQVGAMLLLRSPSPLLSFEDSQVHELALHYLEMQSHGYSVALVFFGVHLVVLGLLLFESTRFPRLLGALVTLSGLAFLTDSFLVFLHPALEAAAAPILSVFQSAELLLALWLLVRGANNRRPSPADG